MADHIPFATGETACRLIGQYYSDSDVVRIPIDRWTNVKSHLLSTAKRWLDPSVDGMDNPETRADRPWFEFMSKFPNFGKICESAYQASPIQVEVSAFVKGVLDECRAADPAWITVPQLPLVDGAGRNKINRALATGAGQWKSLSSFRGKLVLPLVITNQRQVNGKTERNPKVDQAERLYIASQADGFWVVDKTLADDSGSKTLRNARFPGLIGLHEELNQRITSRIRIAGPYWGLNIVLWARGLVDYPAIGIGSGYQYSLAGGHAMPPSAQIAIPALRRRVGVANLRLWLDRSVGALSTNHPAHGELVRIRSQLTPLSQAERARGQVAAFYKAWFEGIAAQPKPGRSLALFQDLSAAYALGRALPDLTDEGTARRPESVAEPLMLSCL